MDFLQWKQSCKFPVHFTLFVSIRFAESALELESVCIFSACITRSLRSCISWPVFFPGGCKGPLWVVWREAWLAADLHKHLRSGRGIVHRRVRRLSRGAGLGLGSEHLQTEESARDASVRDARFTCPKDRMIQSKHFTGAHWGRKDSSRLPLPIFVLILNPLFCVWLQ